MKQQELPLKYAACESREQRDIADIREAFVNAISKSITDAAKHLQGFYKEEQIDVGFVQALQIMTAVWQGKAKNCDNQ